MAWSPNRALLSALARRLPAVAAVVAAAFVAGGVEWAGAQTGRKPVEWVNHRDFDLPGLEHHVLASESLGHDVGYVVWLPAGYDEQPHRRWPTVYFLHGMGGNESADAAGFAGLLKRGVDEGYLPACIAVFPNGGRSGYRGGVEQMITGELMPLIDAEYQTLASGGSRAVAGFSMGGQGAVRLSLLYPGRFCAAVSWGGGLFRGGEEILAAAAENAAAIGESGLQFLLVNGDQDRPEAYGKLVAAFEEREIPHRVEVLPDTPHNLGRYYHLHGEAMVRFLGERLGQPAAAAAD